MSNSSLVSYTKISPNRTSPRNHKIDTITIHCVVGQLSVETIGSIFAPKSRQASCNYGIGTDGRIGMYCEEKDRSWCSSNRSNDHRAITIEVACDKTHPYAINNKVYNALIDLLVDVCKRNDIKELKWKADKTLIGQVDKQNMTVHRWFANTACPGDYLYNLHGEIADDVNKRLNVVVPVKDTKIDTVKEVQKWLNNSYASGLSVDGDYGPKTKAALVKALQKALGVSVDGKYGPKTSAAVRKNNLKKGSKGEMVKVLQGFLVCNGYAKAYVDGSFGPGTEKIVKEYQAKNGLNADGIVGSGTFSLLCK
jgi:N-acetyl-anhydromuramyl-L-alanine amidase AmpD